MSQRGPYRVKELAALTGVSVRTLHHYDAIELLRPSARSAAGYRLYDDRDVLRLQHILLQRELGFSLAEIRESLRSPDFDHRASLLQQREKLQQRVAQSQRMLEAVQLALSLLDGPGGRTMTKPRTENQPNPQSVFSRTAVKQLFDGFDPAEYEGEAEARWGATDAYKISAQRTASYTKEDFERLAQAQLELYGALAKLKSGGASATDEAALDLAERQRLLIDEWFYPCSKEMHLGLAELYENDARFRANIDKHGEGLTAFLSEAIRANARR